MHTIETMRVLQGGRCIRGCDFRGRNCGPTGCSTIRYILLITITITTTVLEHDASTVSEWRHDVLCDTGARCYICRSLQWQVQVGVNLNLNWPITSPRGRSTYKCTYTYIKHQYPSRTWSRKYKLNTIILLQFLKQKN